MKRFCTGVLLLTQKELMEAASGGPDGVFGRNRIIGIAQCPSNGKHWVFLGPVREV